MTAPAIAISTAAANWPPRLVRPDPGLVSAVDTAAIAVWGIAAGSIGGTT